MCKPKFHVQDLVYLLIASINNTENSIYSSSHYEWTPINIASPTYSVKGFIFLIYKAHGKAKSFLSIQITYVKYKCSNRELATSYIFINIRLQHSNNTTFQTLVNSHLTSQQKNWRLESYHYWHTMDKYHEASIPILLLLFIFFQFP